MPPRPTRSPSGGRGSERRVARSSTSARSCAPTWIPLFPSRFSTAAGGQRPRRAQLRQRVPPPRPRPPRRSAPARRPMARPARPARSTRASAGAATARGRSGRRARRRARRGGHTCPAGRSCMCAGASVSPERVAPPSRPPSRARAGPTASVRRRPPRSAGCHGPSGTRPPRSAAAPDRPRFRPCARHRLSPSAQ